MVIGAAAGAFSVSGHAALVLAALFAADRLTDLPAPLRALASAALAVATIACLYAKSAVYVVRPPGAAAAAAALERKYPALGGFALSAAELAFAPSARSSAPSPQLVDMAVEEASSRSALLSAAGAVPLSGALRQAVLAAVATAVWVTAAGLFPAESAVFLRRMADPFGGAAYPTRTRIVAIDAPHLLPKDAPFAAKVLLEGALPEQAEFRFRPDGGRTNSIRAGGNNGLYECRLERVGASFSLSVEAGDAHSSGIRVEVVERPAVTSLGARVEYPSYCGAAPATVSGGGITALAGSRVTLVAEFNKPVASARLDFAGGSEVEGRMTDDASSAAFEFALTSDDSYRVRLTDGHGFSDIDSPVYPVRALADALPNVLLAKPSRDLTVVAGAVVPLEVEASDDYGIVALAVEYRVSRGSATGQGRGELEGFESAGRAARGSWKWGLGGLSLAPGDEIEFWVSASDNCPYRGGEARSAVRRLKVVTIAEKLAEIEQLKRAAQAVVQNAARKQEASMESIAQAAGRAAR